MIGSRRRLPALRRLLIVAAALACAGAIGFVPFAGRFLVREDPLAHVDAIFVLEGAHAERWMEAADLHKAGYAPVIVLSPGWQEDAEAVLRARGVRYPTNPMLARDALLQMGIPASAIVLPERTVDNTGEEAALLRELASAHGWRRVLVITSKYHCRRAGLAFRQGLRGSGIAFSVRATRYDTSDPAHWWRRRAEVRYVLSELQKLFAYRVGFGG